MEGRIWAYTLMVDDVPVACIGLVLQEWGKAEAWALFSNSFRDHILTIYRLIKVGLKMAFHEKNLRRIQATIDPSYPETVKWMESLGFECEGRLKNYGPGENHPDHLMYARTN
jgi:RimJ/RimL family protein N-acetyltransferase